MAARSGGLAGLLYVHAKIAIVDDTGYVGSANFDEHSLFNDTEMNVVNCDPRIARAARLRLWAEHLQRSIEEVSGRAGPARRMRCGARSPASSSSADGAVSPLPTGC